MIYCHPKLYPGTIGQLETSPLGSTIGRETDPPPAVIKSCSSISRSMLDPKTTYRENNAPIIAPL